MLLFFAIAYVFKLHTVCVLCIHTVSHTHMWHILLFKYAAISLVCKRKVLQAEVADVYFTFLLKALK